MQQQGGPHKAVVCQKNKSVLASAFSAIKAVTTYTRRFVFLVCCTVRMSGFDNAADIGVYFMPGFVIADTEHTYNNSGG